MKQSENMMKNYFILGPLAVVAFASACGSVKNNNNATLCVTPADCTDPAVPFCVAGVCHACTGPNDCTAASPTCEATTLECGPCIDDSVCTSRAGTTHCGASGSCVGCTTSAQCSAAAPVCDGTSFSCRTCAKDSECASGACNTEAGSCIAESAILYVTITGTDTAPCTKAAPCTLKRAANIVDVAHPTVVVADGTYAMTATNGATIDAARSALFVGSAAAILKGSGDGKVAINSVGRASVTIRGVSADNTIIDCTDALVRVIGVRFSGVSVATKDCDVRAEHSVFADGILFTTDSGVGAAPIVKINDCEFIDQLMGDAISVNATGSITNNVFRTTSAANCTNGCLMVRTFTPRPTSLLVAYNTFSNASVQLSDGTKFIGNIVYAPTLAPNLLSRPTLDSNLMTPLPAGFPASNITGDPQFVDAANNNFHLKPTSPAIDKGPVTLPAGAPATDFDGKPRLKGAASDMGAFEYAP
jgi:hypothetical protein